MSYVEMRKILAKAYGKGYAVRAFNVFNYLTMG